METEFKVQQRKHDRISSGALG